MKTLLRKKHTNAPDDASEFDDDGKSVRSTATTSTATALKLGAGFLKNKLTTPFKRSSRAENFPDTTAADASKGVIAENVNLLNTNNNTCLSPKTNDEAPSLRLRVRELQVELDGEKRKNQQLERALESDHQATRQKILELQSTLDREREAYHAMINGENVDEAVRLQADALHEYQGVIDVLQTRVEQLQEELGASEQKCEQVDQAHKKENAGLLEKFAMLEATNATLQKKVAESESQNSNQERAKQLEKENELLRQRLASCETDLVKARKGGDANSQKSVSEKQKLLEQENAELKRMQSIEEGRTRNLQAKIINLEKELSVYVLRCNAEEDANRLKVELEKVRGELAAKEEELASIASATEVELAKLEESCTLYQKQKMDAEMLVKSLEADLTKTRSDLARQNAYWKEKLEHDEHYQRATEAARNLLKQKKISKAEFDQVIKAAQEASRVWNE